MYGRERAAQIFRAMFFGTCNLAIIPSPGYVAYAQEHLAPWPGVLCGGGFADEAFAQSEPCSGVDVTDGGAVGSQRLRKPTDGTKFVCCQDVVGPWRRVLLGIGSRCAYGVVVVLVHTVVTPW